MGKRKLIVVSGIYPPDKGGPAQFVSQFSIWAARKGTPVRVVSLTDAEPKKSIDDLVDLELITRNQHIIKRMLKTIFSISRPLMSKRIVLANGMFLEVLMTSFLPNTKIISKVPGDIVWERARNNGETILDINRYQGAESLKMKVFRFFFSLSLKRSALVIAPSRHLVQLLESWGIPREKIVLIRNSADVSKFSPASNNESSYDVITVCRLVSWKGVDELIKICAELNLSLAVVGDGPERKYLESLATKLGAKVAFLGEKPADEVPELLRSASTFVLNSQYEGSPHALIEAMSSENLVIARQSTGTSEVIEHLVDGILVSEDFSLKTALRLSMTDENEVIRMRKKSREKVINEYDRSKLFEQMYSLVMGPDKL